MVQVFYSNQFKKDPVVDCLKWILFLGRIIGVVPYTFKFKPRLQLQFRWFSLSALQAIILALVALTIGVIQLGQTIQNTGTFPTIMDELRNLEEPSFRITVVLVYIYFIKNAQNILELLNHWSTTSKSLDLSSSDLKFPKFCFAITTLVLGIGIAENLLCDICTWDNYEGSSILDKVLKVNGRAFFEVVPGNRNTIMSIFLLYSMKMGTYSWNFGDIFLIVVCRAISHKFWQINEEIKKYIIEKEIHEKEMVHGSKDTRSCSIQIDDTNNVMNGINGKIMVEGIKKSCTKDLVIEGDNCYKGEIIHHPLQMKLIHQSQVKPCIDDNVEPPEVISSWSEIRDKVIALCKLSQYCTNLVAPLVLACYGCNLYLISQRVFSLLHNSKSYDTSVYSYVSAIQFTLRVVLVTYHASQVYHSTEEIVSTLERSSDTAFSDTACRLERLLERHPVGVTLFGAFQITRKFFISIVSFLFTTEIILLQAMSASPGMSGSDGAINGSDDNGNGI